MEHHTPELSRRQLLAAAIAMTSINGLAQGSVIKESKRAMPERATDLGPDARSRLVTFDVQVSRNGQQAVTVPISITTTTTVVIVCDMQMILGPKVACLIVLESTSV